MRNLLNSSINWITFSNDDVNKAREIIKSLGGDSTIDAIGLRIPFEAISNILFPGTSTLHTRLRYQVFVPAIIYSLYERKPILNPGKFLYNLEVNLQNILLESGESLGVIGRKSKENLKYWPSLTYWGALNTMQIWGKVQVSKGDIFDDLSGKGPNLIKNDDGTIEWNEGEFRASFVYDHEFALIAKSLFKDFKNGKLKNFISFELTKAEAEFYKKKYTSLFPNSLSNYLIRLRKNNIKQLESLFNISQTGISVLDEILDQCEKYSRISQGINYAYCSILCKHRANYVYKKNEERKKEWNDYAENNLKHLINWFKNNNHLKNWSINNLEASLENYKHSSVIDLNLKVLCNNFINSWKEEKNPVNFLIKLAPIVIQQEKIRRGPRSHFRDSTISIADNTKGLEKYSNHLLIYRWNLGKQNAIDIVSKLKGK